MKYSTVTEDDVYKLLIGTSIDFMNPIGGVISLVNIASLLKTSRYQVKKRINELKSKGFVELKCINLPLEDEPCPPYWGYTLTNKGKDTELYRTAEVRQSKLIEECFAL